MAESSIVAAPSFDNCGVRVGQDLVKGRIVIAEQSFAPGDVIFCENAFVFAPWTMDGCEICEEIIAEDRKCYCQRSADKESPSLENMNARDYTEALVGDFTMRLQLAKQMAAMEGISEIDHARCILKCLALYEKSPQSLDAVLHLSFVNYDDALATAKVLHNDIPQIFPKNGTFTVEMMATLIAVLNTNCHELENLGGTALFLNACRMEHSCLPNCSFTTYDEILWMTAIAPISKGDSLSIDYGNFFYRPYLERQTELRNSYGFSCNCPACTKLPDVCRAFRCQETDCLVKEIGDVCATVLPTDEDQNGERSMQWKCRTCGAIATSEHISFFLAAESALLEEGLPESLQDVENIIAQNIVHPRHYLLFWALDTIGCDAAANVDSVLSSDSVKEETLQVWTRIISLMNETVKGPHHEKTIYYDNLAQIYVLLGKYELAKESYKSAYEMSCIVSGKHTKPTQNLKQLMENPPASVEELRKHYSTATRVHREVNDDDDNDESDDEDGE